MIPECYCLPIRYLCCNEYHQKCRQFSLTWAINKKYRFRDDQLIVSQNLLKIECTTNRYYDFKSSVVAESARPYFDLSNSTPYTSHNNDVIAVNLNIMASKRQPHTFMISEQREITKFS
jgi:hypothetical protein